MSYPPSAGSPYAAAPHGSGQAPYGAAAPQPKGRKGPLILLLSGVAVCVAAVVLIVVFVASGARAIGDLQPIDANGTAAVQLESTAVYGLYGNGGSQCTVTDADGREVEVTIPTSNVEVNDRRLFGVVAPNASGDYTITCSTSFAGGDVFFGPLVDAQDIGRMVLGVLVVIGMFMVGIPLAIGGIIWMVVRNSRNKRAQQAWSGGYPTGRPGF
ncbi:hypothetical protein [Actinomyces ruminicola]|uniref:Uncharacterized protein n=1 Tax=Actinomyces ruminicola TaxID=332524 RepID=A0A1G9ZNY5_9ACTO|nr:hypothetical protein [Actinomyces ruminicola]SDN23109.1 hypothetical protein SAMN04487766_1195 [Actinomyces ruminicola]